MNKYVEGSYTTVEEAVHAVKALFTQGYAKEDLLIVTDDSKKQEISDKTEVTVTTDWSLNRNKNDRNESMMDKIKDTFTGDSDDSEENNILDNHKDELRKGNILVLAETTPEVDRDPTTDPNSEYDNHSSIEDPDVQSIPQTTDGFKKDNPEDIHIDNSDISHRP